MQNANMVKINTFKASLSSKCFRAVSEQRKTDERDSRLWPHEKWNESPKMKEGAIFCAVCDSWNSTETFPMQANLKQKLPHPPFRFC